MKNPVQKALQKLKEAELYTDTKKRAMGLVRIKDVERILEELEIDILNEEENERIQL